MNYTLKDLKSYSATAENPDAVSGQGGKENHGRKGCPCIEPLEAGSTKVLLHKYGSGTIRKIWCTIPPNHPEHLRNLILRMYWDGQKNPSVEVPIGDFFGIAHGRQRNMVTPYVGMQDAKGFNCFIPMPFKKEVQISIENDSDVDVDMFFYQIDFTLGDRHDENTGFFHAQFRRENPCEIKKDYTILDGVKGRGVYIGTVLGIRNLYYDHLQEWWGEGEIKFFMDGDKKFPTICGTGTEDYFCGSYNFDRGGQYKEFCTPYAGLHQVIRPDGTYNSQQRFGLYRWHITDPIRFEKDLKVTIQDLGWRAGGRYLPQKSDIASVAFWYQAEPHNKFPEMVSWEELEVN